MSASHGQRLRWVPGVALQADELNSVVFQIVPLDRYAISPPTDCVISGSARNGGSTLSRPPARYSERFGSLPAKSRFCSSVTSSRNDVKCYTSRRDKSVRTVHGGKFQEGGGKSPERCPSRGRTSTARMSSASWGGAGHLRQVGRGHEGQQRANPRHARFGGECEAVPAERRLAANSMPPVASSHLIC